MQGTRRVLGGTARNGPPESNETIIFTIGEPFLVFWRAPSFEYILRVKRCKARVGFWAEQLEIELRNRMRPLFSRL